MTHSQQFALHSRVGRALFALIACLVCAACSRPKPPSLTPRSARVLSVSATGVQLEVALDVTNPNAFPLVAHAVDGRLSLGAGGAELGQAHADPASSIPAHATSTVTSELAVSWTNLAALAPFLLSAAPVPYQFSGTATLGGEDLNLSVPFTLNGVLTREQVLNLGLGGLTRPGLP
jgi:LEA14-like dessication related protein